MSERDFEAMPYHRHEQRVADYLVELTGIGGGADPIGFLIASHRALVERDKRNRATLLRIKQRLGFPGHDTVLVGRDYSIARLLRDLNDLERDG
jgi:hypothetical protein